MIWGLVFLNSKKPRCRSCKMHILRLHVNVLVSCHPHCCTLLFPINCFVWVPPNWVFLPCLVSTWHPLSLSGIVLFSWLLLNVHVLYSPWIVWGMTWHRLCLVMFQPRHIWAIWLLYDRVSCSSLWCPIDLKVTAISLGCVQGLLVSTVAWHPPSWSVPQFSGCTLFGRMRWSCSPCPCQSLYPTTIVSYPCLWFHTESSNPLWI